MQSTPGTLNDPPAVADVLRPDGSLAQQVMFVVKCRSGVDEDDLTAGGPRDLAPAGRH